MNKETGLSIAILSIALVILGVLTSKAPSRNVGISQTEVGYTNVAVGSTNCHGDSGGKLIAATSSGRTSFTVFNNSTNTIQVCKDSTCSATTGLSLTTGTQQGNSFTQTDAYYGPWSCFSTVGTSTLGGWISN